VKGKGRRGMKAEEGMVGEGIHTAYPHYFGKVTPLTNRHTDTDTAVIAHSRAAGQTIGSQSHAIDTA